MKVKIIKNTGGAKVYIDDKEIKNISGLKVDFNGWNRPTISLEIQPNDIYITED